MTCNIQNADLNALHDGGEFDVVGTGSLTWAAETAEQVPEGERIVRVCVVRVGQFGDGLLDEVGRLGFGGGRLSGLLVGLHWSR